MLNLAVFTEESGTPSLPYYFHWFATGNTRFSFAPVDIELVLEVAGLTRDMQKIF